MRKMREDARHKLRNYLYDNSHDADVRELVEALRDLHDEQNGAPLVRREKEWQAAVDGARKALAKWEGKV